MFCHNGLMKTVYYLPGRDSSITDGLGLAIKKSGFKVIGRDLLSDFINYRIAQQIEIIKKDIEEYLSAGSLILIARSYGAFLLLQTLVEMMPFPGRVLLFEAGGVMFFRPPRADKLMNLAKEQNFPAPKYLEIHTGTEDTQCHPSIAEEFSRLMPEIKLNLVEGAGHSLEQQYVERVLERFLFGR